MVPALLAAALIAPLSFRVTPEIRSTYVSLGKIVEDRPMQTTQIRVACDLGDFGRIGIRNWNVSSLTDRRDDVHRHALYHTEFGPRWEYDFELAEGWKLKSDFGLGWTIYDGFDASSGNRSYRWWQEDFSLENPYLSPFGRIRRCVHGNDYLYTRLGVRHRFDLGGGILLTPEVAIDGGSSRNQNRVFGRRADGSSLGSGFYSISPRLELTWNANEYCSVFVYVEQYDVLGSARSVNKCYNYRCAHNDWTHGGVGLRLKF